MDLFSGRRSASSWKKTDMTMEDTCSQSLVEGCSSCWITNGILRVGSLFNFDGGETAVGLLVGV